MGKDELLKLLTEAAAAREELDTDCKASLAESQITVLNRKLGELRNERERVFQSMADAIMVSKNQIEAYLKLENHIKTEIEILGKGIGHTKEEA